MPNEPEHCPHCGAALRQYWHCLTPGLVKMLMKFGRAVWEQRKNEIHLIADLSDPALKLTTTEYANFQKLRFFALVAKVREADGSHKIGYWLLTRRGNQFLKGETTVSSRVKTYRNKKIDEDPERLHISRFKNETGWFEHQFDFEVIDGSPMIKEPGQASLFAPVDNQPIATRNEQVYT